MYNVHTYMYMYMHMYVIHVCWVHSLDSDNDVYGTGSKEFLFTVFMYMYAVHYMYTVYCVPVHDLLLSWYRY